MPSKLGSPWIENLNRRRPLAGLTGDLQADVAVVGAGIAGVTTAYFLLTKTKKKIALIEGDRVAHGATGHNAGQMVSYFERPFHDIAEEFGLKMAAAGQRTIESAWDLLEEIRHELQLQTPCLIFHGYAGCVDLQELMTQLRNNERKIAAGLVPETVLVADDFAQLKQIPKAFHKLFIKVPRQKILDLLQTKDSNYVALLSGKKGCMNSARFCEEALSVLIKLYPHRLTVAEKTPIDTVNLYKHHAKLHSAKHVITAKRVILCTNGFESLHIKNHAGADIDVKFHHLVRGSVGYMAAFTEKPPAPPMAISYLPSHLSEVSGAYDSDPYYYVTRRPYAKSKTEDLVCVGGPEALMDDTNNYKREHPYPAEAKKMIDKFVQKTYRHTGRRLEYSHLWHGLMGYTPNGIRCVGAEPCNPVLMYNLGCNGVGILPSIAGSHRIAQIVAGKHLEPSIFDPADQRNLDEGTNSNNFTLKLTVSHRAIAVFVAFWTVAITVVIAFAWAEPVRAWIASLG